MKYVGLDDYAQFDQRYAACPLCRRDNSGGVAIDEHPMPIPVIVRPEPIDPSARYNPRAAEATFARVRCPASLAPLVVAEDL
ncbi:MAG TPA: hypothetical protein VLE97_08720 [Gaiellaceae bacterium]|nr:hypothetical protein [Gaiellaceae bacterium]